MNKKQDENLKNKIVENKRFLGTLMVVFIIFILSLILINNKLITDNNLKNGNSNFIETNSKESQPPNNDLTKVFDTPKIDIGYSIIENVMGEGYFEDPNGDINDLTLNISIQFGSGSILRTADGYISLKLPDGSNIFLEKNTILELTQVADPRGLITETVLELKKGEVLVIVDLIEGFSFQINIPTGAWGKVVGSIMGLKYEPKNNHLFNLDCIEGHCLQAGDSNKILELIGGESGFLDSSLDPQKDENGDQDNWEPLLEWANIENQEENQSSPIVTSEPTLEPTIYIPNNTTPTSTAAPFQQCYWLSTTATNGSIIVSPSPNCPDGSNQYLPGTVVTASVTADSRYFFNTWTGALVGNDNPASIVMNNYQEITANFIKNAEDVNLTVNYVPSNISVYRNHPEDKFQSGTNLSLKVTAPGYYLTHWTGDASGSNNPVNIYMDTDKEVTAYFEECIRFRTKLHGPGSFSHEYDYESVSCVTDSVKPGSQIRLVPHPQTGATFIGWDLGPCTGIGDCILTITSDTIVRANFDYCNYLSVSVNGSGTVNKPPSNNNPDCYTNSSVNIEAIPNAGYRFDHWEGACSGSSLTCQVQLDSNKSVTAVFVPASCFNVSVGAEPNGGGNVSIQTPENCSSGGGGYNLGTEIIVTESINPGLYFKNWSGCSGGSGSCSFTISTDTNITANYEWCNNIYQAINPSEGGSININTAANCGDRYLPETSVNVSASTNEGFYFMNWSNGDTSTTTTYSYNSLNNIIANFENCKLLSLSTSGAGTISASPDSNCLGNNYYLPGTVITVSSTPEEGNHLDSWSGVCSGNGECSFPINSNKTVTGNFVISDP